MRRVSEWRLSNVLSPTPAVTPDPRMMDITIHLAADRRGPDWEQFVEHLNIADDQNVDAVRILSDSAHPITMQEFQRACAAARLVLPLDIDLLTTFDAIPSLRMRDPQGLGAKEIPH